MSGVNDQNVGATLQGRQAFILLLECFARMGQADDPDGPARQHSPELPGGDPVDRQPLLKWHTLGGLEPPTVTRSIAWSPGGSAIAVPEAEPSSSRGSGRLAGTGWPRLAATRRKPPSGITVAACECRSQIAAADSAVATPTSIEMHASSPRPIDERLAPRRFTINKTPNDIAPTVAATKANRYAISTPTRKIRPTCHETQRGILSPNQNAPSTRP